MDINVRSVLNGETKLLPFSYAIPLDYSEDGYSVKGDALVDGSVKDSGGYMRLEATCRATYNTVCARCLAPIEGECVIEFARTLAVKLENEQEEDEYLLIGEGSVVNIDEVISEELLLSLPTRSLCKEDCKGLCPKCGCDLNKTECSCVTKELDPRWAALKNFKAKD